MVNLSFIVSKDVLQYDQVLYVCSYKLSCGSAGNSYPADAIDNFIDDNKALIRRMYGELQV